MRAMNPSSLLLVLLWASPAGALDWWVPDDPQAQALEVALLDLWPGNAIVIRAGSPPIEGDAVWVDQDTLALRLGGSTRRAEQVGDPGTQVVLVRSWMEAGLAPPPPPPPPPSLPRVGPGARAPRPLHTPHLLPGAGAIHGAELAVSGVATGTLDTDPIEAVARGYAPVVAAAASWGRLRANATVWNLWEPERSHRPMGVAGISVVAVDRGRWRLAPWVGAAGGWKQTEPGCWEQEPSSALAASAGKGPGGAIGAGASLEVSSERLTWDLSLPLAGLMIWQFSPSACVLSSDEPAPRAAPALLLPYPEAGISWRLTDADTMRFGLLASVPSIRWRRAWAHSFTELSAATSVGLGQLGDGDLLLGGALQASVGVQL